MTRHTSDPTIALARLGPQHRRGLVLWLAVAALLSASAVGIAAWAGGEGPGAADLRVSLATLGWPVAALAGAAMAAADYRDRLLWSNALLQPNRGLLVAVRVGQGALAGALTGAVMAAAPIVGHLVTAATPVPTARELALVIGFSALAGGVGSALVIACADHVAAIVIIAAYAMLGEGLLGGFLGPTLEAYLPGSALRDALTGQGGMATWFIWPTLTAIAVAAAATRLARDDIC
jgi:hypothetical protein